jgi:hypothetical protein
MSDTFLNIPNSDVEIAKNSGIATGSESQINFIEGANVTITLVDDPSNNRMNVTIDAAAAGGGYTTIQEEGSNLTQRSKINFIGPSITAADDAGSSRTNVTLSQNPFSNAVSTTVVDLVDGATISTDASLGNHFRVTLTADRDLENPTNATDGQKIIFEIIQDSTGSRILNLDTKFAFGSDITSIVLSTSPDLRDFVGCLYNQSTDKFYIIAFVKGY